MSAEPLAPRVPFHVDDVRLVANELPYPPPSTVRKAITNCTTPINRYADPSCRTLRAALAAELDVPEATLMLGAGSSSVLQRLVKVTCQHTTDAAMWATPGFDAFDTFAEHAGASAQRVPTSPDGTVDLKAMLASITSATRIILLVNPHNPTGTALPGAALREFLDGVDDQVLVVLDEAYIEFCDDARVADGIELARDHWASGRDNLAVVRTFSKAYGLASLRIGYGVAPHDLANRVHRAQVPREISSQAQAAAVEALKSRATMYQHAAEIVDERGRVRAQLRKLGYAPPISQANFLWLPLADDTERFVKHCRRQGIYVLAVGDHGVRVSIGSANENDMFLNAAQTWATI